MPRYPNARLQLVHLRGAKNADHFLVTAERAGFLEGTCVRVQLPDGTWWPGVVDGRHTTGAGCPIMVTLEDGSAPQERR